MHDLIKAVWAFTCGLMRAITGMPQESYQHYRLIAHYGDRQHMHELYCDERCARGATTKAFAWHEADKAVLHKLIEGEWKPVAEAPRSEES